MGLFRAIPLFCSAFALMTLVAPLMSHPAQAAEPGAFACFTQKLKAGLKLTTKDRSLPIQVPPGYRATDQEIAQTFSGDHASRTLKLLWSERSLSRFRKSPEALAIRDSLVKGGKFELKTDRMYAQGTAIRTQDRVRISIENVQIRGIEGDYHGFNTETEGLKTGLAKVLSGMFEASHAIAANHPELTHVEFVADHILNTKLAQALSQMGFYSKKLDRRMTDDEIKAVAVNNWIEVRKHDPSEVFVPQDLLHFVTLELDAKITRPADSPQNIRIQFPEAPPVGDPSEEKTRKALADRGYTNKEIQKILRVLSRRLSPDEEYRYQLSHGVRRSH